MDLHTLRKAHECGHCAVEHITPLIEQGLVKRFSVNSSFWQPGVHAMTRQRRPHSRPLLRLCPVTNQRIQENVQNA